jgi:hypothetical protein
MESSGLSYGWVYKLPLSSIFLEDKTYSLVRSNSYSRHRKHANRSHNIEITQIIPSKSYAMGSLSCLKLQTIMEDLGTFLKCLSGGISLTEADLRPQEIMDAYYGQFAHAFEVTNAIEGATPSPGWYLFRLQRDSYFRPSNGQLIVRTFRKVCEIYLSCHEDHPNITVSFWVLYPSWSAIHYMS